MRGRLAQLNSRSAGTHSRTHSRTRVLEPSARHLSWHALRAPLRRRISKVEGQVQLIEQVLESVDQQGAIAERSNI